MVYLSAGMNFLKIGHDLVVQLQLIRMANLTQKPEQGQAYYSCPVTQYFFGPGNNNISSDDEYVFQ